MYFSGGSCIIWLILKIYVGNTATIGKSEHHFCSFSRFALGNTVKISKMNKKFVFFPELRVIFSEITIFRLRVYRHFIERKISVIYYGMSVHKRSRERLINSWTRRPETEKKKQAWVYIYNFLNEKWCV